MTGFTGLQRQLFTTQLFIFSPNSTICDSSMSTAFCSNAALYTVDTCGGYFGAALFDSRENAIRGIVILDKFCSIARKQWGNFHSIDDYRDWILKVSGANKVGMSLLLVLSAFVITITT
jgi:hypothetical protein